MNDSLTALSKAGVSIRLDDLSRDRLVSGSLARGRDQPPLLGRVPWIMGRGRVARC